MVGNQKMSDVKFNLKPVYKKTYQRINFKLNPVTEIPPPTRIKDLTKADVLEWKSRYDQEHPWWVQEEQKIRTTIQKHQEIDQNTLHQIFHWKFLTLRGREILIKGYLEEHSDEEIRIITKRALSLPTYQDNKRIKTLRRLYGIGIALASTILTFYDPQNYGIYDIHVYREMYGPEPSTIFALNKHYIQMLQDLRRLSKRFQLPVRTIEKALFKKNLEK